MKRIGISDLCSESSPTFVEDGGTSYSTHRSTWICVFVSQTIPLRWKHWAIYHRYPCLSITLTRKDEDNIYLGLQQHGQRVRRVALQAPPLSFRMLFEPMDKLFPRLEDLSLLSTATEEDQEIGLVLPETFQAPDLHRLALHDIGLFNEIPITHFRYRPLNTLLDTYWSVLLFPSRPLGQTASRSSPSRRTIHWFLHPDTSSKYRGRSATSTDSTCDTSRPQAAHIPGGGHIF